MKNLPRNGNRIEVIQSGQPRTCSLVAVDVRSKMGKKRRQNAKRMPVGEGDDDEYANMPEPDKESEEYFNDEIESFALKNDKILLDDSDIGSNEESDYVDDDEDEIMKIDDEDDEDDVDLEEAEEDDEDDDENFLAEEDENDEETGLPSRKAWGKKKKEFYDSNLKDADHFENEEEEELFAEQEEKEAMALQQRMLSHLDQEDFDFFEAEEQMKNEIEDSKEQEEETHIVKDLKLLSREEKIQILLKDSPELFVLLEDYQVKLKEVVEKYHPLLLLGRRDKRISEQGKDFIEVMHQLLLNYCLNISFYLLLIAKRENVKDHPVIEKIVEYRNLISKMEPLVKRHEEEIKTILKNESIVNDITSTDGESSHKLDLVTLVKEAKSMKDMILAPKPKELNSKKMVKAKKAAKKVSGKASENAAAPDPWEYYNRVASNAMEKKKKKSEAYQASKDMDNQFDEEDDDDAEGKRAITYEMAKNKGLIRKRKKENRNPRVKHKMKFKKAIVKRKSQVQAIRNEAVNYGGELTGIRSRLTKSVKIK